MTKVRLLSLGIAYDKIDELSSEEVESLLLIDQIIKNRENEESLKNSF
jgi:hypothetical protein